MAHANGDGYVRIFVSVVSAKTPPGYEMYNVLLEGHFEFVIPNVFLGKGFDFSVPLRTKKVRETELRIESRALSNLDLVSKYGYEKMVKLDLLLLSRLRRAMAAFVASRLPTTWGHAQAMSVASEREYLAEKERRQQTFATPPQPFRVDGFPSFSNICGAFSFEHKEIDLRLDSAEEIHEFLDLGHL